MVLLIKVQISPTKVYGATAATATTTIESVSSRMFSPSTYLCPIN